jgi:hypothetical protein
MDRAEATGLGVALTAHGVLLAALSIGLAGARLPPLRCDPIQVSFVEDVGLTSAAPAPAQAPPAPGFAPEPGIPEETAPAPPPPVPAPRPVQAPPERPAAPLAAKPVRPAPDPASAKAPPKAAPARTPPPSTASRSAAAQAARGPRLGADFLKGLGRDPSTSRSQAPPAAAMSAEALASIKSVIESQIQPCADRQRDPGPGANQIKVTLNLRLNRDGSLAREPAVVRTAGVTGQNGRYEARVKDLAVAAYVGCSPLHGLPADLYQTSKGGWSNLNMTYHLP